MAVVSIINFKGGVGKTILTLALSDFLSSLYRKRILLIDLDPQANLSIACIGEPRWEDLDQRKQTVADVFQDNVPDGPGTAPPFQATNRISGAAPVHLLASTPRLVDVEIDAMEADSAWRRRRGSPDFVLTQAIGGLLHNYDYVLIDCPPSLGVITCNGLALSDGYLVPVVPSQIAITGLALLSSRISRFARGIQRTLKPYGTIVNRVEQRSHRHAAIIRQLEENPEAKPVWTTLVRSNLRAEEGRDQPDPQTLHQRWGYLQGDFSALAEEFVRRIR